MRPVSFYGAAIGAFAVLAANAACHRWRAVPTMCTPRPRRGTGFQRHILTSADSVSRPLTIRVASIDRSPGPLPGARVRWGPVDQPQLSIVPAVRRDSAVFSPGIVAPGTYVVEVAWIGYQLVHDTLVVRPDTRAIEYGLWEDPICLVQFRGRPNMPSHDPGALANRSS